MSEFIDYANAPDEGNENSVEKIFIVSKGKVDGKALRKAPDNNLKANILLNAISQGDENTNIADNILTNNGSKIDTMTFSPLSGKNYSTEIEYTYPDGNGGILTIQYEIK